MYYTCVNYTAALGPTGIATPILTVSHRWVSGRQLESFVLLPIGRVQNFPPPCSYTTSLFTLDTPFFFRLIKAVAP